MGERPEQVAKLFDEVTTSFWEGTVFEHPPSVTLAQSPRRVAPCWFGRYMDVDEPCNGPIQGCHFIKRQQVEKTIGARLPAYVESVTDLTDWSLTCDEIVIVAAWDARNGIPGCERHHHHFDFGSLLVPLELVHRAAPEVVEFTRWYELEYLLERRCVA